MTDKELMRKCRKELYSAVIGDILDTLGFVNQFLPQRIQPIDPKMVIIGRAMTVQEVDSTGPLNKPFGKMFEALDDLKEDEVYICSGSSLDYAQWGGLMSNRAMHLKAAGAIMNAYSRDTNEILSLGFPVFSSGRYAKDQGIRGQVIDFRCPITFDNGVRVDSGDLVFADLDGVVVVPKLVENEVLEKAFEKCSKENKVRDAILKGMSTVEAFDKFGVM